MSAGATLSATIDPASMARFMANMEKRAQFIHAGQKSIVEIGAVKLVTALRAATVTAKKKHTVIENPDYFSKRNDMVVAGGSNAKASRFAKRSKIPRFAVLFDFKCPKTATPYAMGGGYLPIKGADTMTDARKSPLAQIKDLGGGGYRGIAKQSWAWTLKSLGKSAPNERPGATDSSFTVLKNGNEFDATWTGVNRIAYERKAMTRSVTSSVHAAATMLRKETERLAAKAAGEIGFAT